MTLFSIAFNNIKRNFKNYWAYFLSTTFSVFVLYLFLSILYNNNVQTQLGSMKKFIFLFLISSYLTAFFSAFFIWYSNSFFIKSRKKDFATYMLLGITKKQTSCLSLIENLIVMVLAFFLGICFGVIFNKLFVMILFSMIEVSGNVQFQFSIKAFKYCLIIFTLVFIIIGIHSSMLIYKNNLIDLFNASKKAEKGLKVSIITFIMGILSITFLGYGYYLAIKKLPLNLFLSPKVVLLVVAGTILLITGIVSLFIGFSKKNEKRLYSGTKLISTSQLYYRYKGNVGTLSVIAITTTIALCAMITCFGLFDKTEENSRYMRPFSIEYINESNSTDKIFEAVLKSHPNVHVKYKDSFELLKVNTKNPLTSMDYTFFIINESEFDKINNHEKLDRKADLKGNNDCYYIQAQNFVANKNAIGRNVNLPLVNNTIHIKITGTDNKPFIAMDHFMETFVVKDAVYDEIKMTVPHGNTLKIIGYMLNNDILAKNFLADLTHKMPRRNRLLTFYYHYIDGLKLLGMMAFIGIFIGLLFLTATGSIIYFKMAMEAREDKNKFVTLMKIGVSRKEIKTAISKELLIFFGLPFIIAAVNTYAASTTLGKMLGFNLDQSYVLIILTYAVLYSIYYLLTLNSYVNYVGE